MAEDVQLLLTDSMKKWIEDLEVSEKGDIYKHVKDIDEGSQVISYNKLLKKFYNVQNKDKEKDLKKKLYLHEFLAGSQIYEEPPKVQEKNPELVKRLKRLQSELDQKEYDTMVKNVRKKQNQNLGEELGADVRSTSRQIVTVMNFLLTVFGAAFFAFFAAQFAWDNLGLRVIFAVIVGCVVAIADLYFLARVEI